MPRIELVTWIDAPPEICFDLARDVRIHAQSTSRAHGTFGLGQTVTFESKNLGFRQRLTVKVVEFDPPRRFVDAMIEGQFRSFTHIHQFEPIQNGALMRDTLIWESPFGILGRLADAVIIKRRLSGLVTHRNSRLKSIAENEV